MSYFTHFFDNETVMAIIQVLPLYRDTQELILEKIVRSIMIEDFYFSIHNYDDEDEHYYHETDNHFEYY